MSVFLQPGAKKKVYWYRFMHNGQVVRRSTKQSNYKVAVGQEATHKSSLSNGDIGIFERQLAPTLAEFAKEFLAWAGSEFRSKPKTLEFYVNGVRRLLEYQPLASSAMDSKEVGSLLVGYKARRQGAGLQVSSVNRELQVLRRLLRLAVEWGRIDSAVTVKMLPGEAHREFVLSLAEESRYLAAAPALLTSVVTLLADTGARPEEIYRLRWESITWVNGRFGTFLITHGKTKAARRMLPMSERVRHVLEMRWESADRPSEGWVWAAPTKSGHIEPSSLRKQHRRALKQAKMRPFVLYSLRHTFLTRLGASGVDAWVLAKIAGHSSIEMSSRYVHPSGDAVLAAMGYPILSAPPLGSQDFGHDSKTAAQMWSEEKLLIS